jgi:hypothetical protein
LGFLFLGVAKPLPNHSNKAQKKLLASLFFLLLNYLIQRLTIAAATKEDYLRITIKQGISS